MGGLNSRGTFTPALAFQGSTIGRSDTLPKMWTAENTLTSLPVAEAPGNPRRFTMAKGHRPLVYPFSSASERHERPEVCASKSTSANGEGPRRPYRQVFALSAQWAGELVPPPPCPRPDSNWRPTA